MGYASRQATDGLQLLHVPKLFLQMHPFRNVARNAPRAHPVSVDHHSSHGVAKNLAVSLGVYFARLLVRRPVTRPDEVFHKLQRYWIIEDKKVSKGFSHSFPRRGPA